MTARIHVLKTWEPFWNAVAAHVKPFEVRRADRDYHVDDLLVLRKVSEDHPHAPILDANGRPYDLLRRVSYILHGGAFGVEPGFVVLGLSAFADNQERP